jgi:hypothetical protein
MWQRFVHSAERIREVAVTIRVTDDLVRVWLQWARNFEEIESWERIAPRAKKWLIKVPSAVRRGRQDLPLHAWFDREGVVPTELVLTRAKRCCLPLVARSAALASVRHGLRRIGKPGLNDAGESSGKT